MANYNNSSNLSSFGADPCYAKWNVVRGDTATFKIEFFQQDGKTIEDISDWTFASSTYDSKGNTVDSLTVDVFDGYVIVTAPPSITTTWGEGFKTIVKELSFDVEVTKSSTEIWTPVIGTITVLGDVTRGGL
jgi:hypothetical protein